MQIDTRYMTHEEWLAARKIGIGGSDAGAICGLNPFRAAIEVYMDKIGEGKPVIENEAMRQGRDLEEYVASGLRRRLEKRYGAVI